MLASRLATGLIAAALIQASFAARLPIRVYTTTDGLAQSTVHHILRDSRGFLWFSTSEGISRYDGYEFRTFREPGSRQQPKAAMLLETPEGEFWAATDQGICQFDPSRAGAPSTGSGYRCAQPVSGPSGRAQIILRDSKDSFWVGTHDGLFHMQAGPRWEFRRVALRQTDATTDGLISALLKDAEGALWVGTSTGLYRLRAGEPAERFTAKDGLPADEVQALATDPAGRLWAGTKGGVSLLTRTPAAHHPIVERTYTVADGLPANLVKAVHFGAQDTLWVTTTGGVGEGVKDGQGAIVGFRAYSTQNGLSHEDVNTLQDDPAGNLWFGTESGGAMKLSRNGFLSYGTEDGLGSPYVIGILETRTGQVCALTRAPGQLFLNFLEGDRFRAVRVPVEPSFHSPQWSGWFQLAAEEPDGGWWLASQRGLLQFPRGWEKTRRPPSRILTARDGLTGDHIYQVFQDSRGGLWVVSRYTPHGLSRRDPSTGLFRPFTAADGLPPLSDESRPNGFGEDTHGQVWIGWGRSGVVRHRQGRFELFTTEDGVPPGGIRRILADRQGRLWLGSGAGGVARVDDPAASRPRFQSYGVPDGISASEIQAIAEDGFGRIYVGTGFGVDRLDPRATGAARVRNFTTLDGLTSGELQTAIRDRNGTLWFGTVQGVSRLEPTPDRPRPAPAVYIIGAKLNGKEILIPNGATHGLELPSLRAGRDQLQIEFVAPSFAPGDRVTYQYRLAPDGDWSQPTVQRAVLYADLPTGSHRFEVRATNADGETSPELAWATLQVTGPLWQQWWFYLLSLGGISLAFYGLHRYDLRRKLELEAVRMRIAQDLHDQIGSGLSQIAILSEVAQRSPGKESVAHIADVARELIDATSDIVWAINPVRDNLPDLAQRMHRFAADLLTARDVALEFRTDGLQSTQAVGSEIRRQVYLIYRECLNNAARHSHGRLVRVSLVKEGRCLVLTVEDDGVGFDTAAASSGNGMASMRQRARALGGSISWSSRPGTTVTLSVPLPE